MKHSIITTAAFFALAGGSQAVIVGGTNGNGTNNAGESTLQSYLSGETLPSFPFWNNMVRYSDASGIYLGYNESTMKGWLITANHVTPALTVGIGGHTYSTPTFTQIGSSDIRLYSFNVGGANPIPSLSPVLLTNAAPTVGETLIMIGRGLKDVSDVTAPYAWATPGFSDAIPFRWGTNIIDEVDVTLAPGNKYFSVDFSEPGTSTAFDGMGSLGDSGGGMFILRDGQWQLSGGMGQIDDGPDAGTATNPAGYGDITYGSDFFDSRAAILSLTGTLIPEPSSLLLASPALLLLLRRRRCETSH